MRHHRSAIHTAEPVSTHGCGTPSNCRRSWGSSTDGLVEPSSDSRRRRRRRPAARPGTTSCPSRVVPHRQDHVLVDVVVLPARDEALLAERPELALEVLERQERRLRQLVERVADHQRVLDLALLGQGPIDRDRLGDEQDAVGARPEVVVAEVVVEEVVEDAALRLALGGLGIDPAGAAAVGQQAHAPVRRHAADAHQADRHRELHPGPPDRHRVADRAAQVALVRAVGREQRRRRQAVVVAPQDVVEGVDLEVQPDLLAELERRHEPQPADDVAGRADVGDDELLAGRRVGRHQARLRRQVGQHHRAGAEVALAGPLQLGEVGARGRGHRPSTTNRPSLLVVGAWLWRTGRLVDSAEK
jgi:hypothetical protein